LEKTLEELKKLVVLKDSTEVGDIVIVVTENPQMVAYALVRGISRDSSKRDEWWQVDLLFLTVPPQPVSWTLRTAQMTGREIFTMGGDKRFVAAIDSGVKEGPEILRGKDSGESKTGLRIIK